MSFLEATSINNRSSLLASEYADEIMVEDTFFTILDSALSNTWRSNMRLFSNFYKLLFSCHIIEFTLHFNN